MAPDVEFSMVLIPVTWNLDRDMTRIKRMALLVGTVGSLCMAGCVARAGGAGVPEHQVLHAGHYKGLSECLYRRMVADGWVVDLSVYTCTRKAEVVGNAEAIQVSAVAGGEGSTVAGSRVGVERIAGYLERCAVERE
ncbi:hypothetical protein SIID45300_00857 [Candidatus Magnetaquicoccaceae bacterium FCR-1]|uniref:Lipoprotein n=2 Tax=Candidatus Magnetaquiglobus chichijimensis TaxID=3141448 RepID=A0ABQ0C6M9_9PROT